MTYTTDFAAADLVVDPSLSHKDQILAYSKAYKKLDNASQAIEVDKNNAIQQNNSALNLEIDKEIIRLKKIAIPFYLAQGKALNLKSAGYFLSDWDGGITNGENSLDQAPDPLVSLFLILLGAVKDGLLESLNTNSDDGASNSPDLLTLTNPLFIFSLLASDALENDNGEIAQLIKNPLTRPIDIVKNTVEELNNSFANDNGDLGNAAKAAAEAAKKAAEDAAKAAEDAAKKAAEEAGKVIGAIGNALGLG